MTRALNRPAPTPTVLLASAVRFALLALADLRTPHPSVEDGRVELHLRDAVTAVERATRTGTGGGVPDAVATAAVAVRMACAHLAARQWEDCYLALRSARDHLSDRLD